MNENSNVNDSLINLRRKGIGGHDIAAILGMHPFQTPLDVYLAKVEGVDNFKPNYIQGRGLALESHLIKHYLEEQFPEIANPDENIADPQYGIVRDIRFVHTEFDFMHAHPDAVIFTYGDKPFRLLECKAPTFTKPGEWGDEGTNQIPDYIKIQCQWYCEIVNVDRVDILVDTQFGMRVYHWFRDFDFGQQLIEEAKFFWNHYILNKQPPPVQTLEDCKIRYPRSNGKEIEGNPDIWGYHTMLKAVKDKQKALDEEEAYLQFEIRKFYGDFEVCTFEGAKLSSYKTQERTDIDREKLKTQYPNVYEACKKVSTNRVLRLNIK